MEEVIFKTLGKGNPFFVQVDSSKNEVNVRREFDNGQVHGKTISLKDLEAINDYVKSAGDWVCLANNVQRLHEGTEGEGLGSFLYTKLPGWNNTADAQLASQIAALFVHSGVFEQQKPRQGRLRFRNKYPAMHAKQVFGMLLMEYARRLQ
jgi:predicted metal-dependent hydrolase